MGRKGFGCMYSDSSLVCRLTGVPDFLIFEGGVTDARALLQHLALRPATMRGDYNIGHEQAQKTRLRFV